MKKLFVIAIIILTVSLCFIACNNKETESEATTVSDQTVADATVVETTAEETTAEETVAAETTAEETTVDETTEEETTVEETTVDTSDPVNNLVPVGKSYDGKTTCYDGRYDFYDDGWIYFKTKYGEFTSLQEAIDMLAGENGDVSVETNGDIGICLSANFPDDGFNYHLYYNYNNCDFVFNHGLTFDDGLEPRGYCYYAAIEYFDGLNRASLDGEHVYIWSGVEGYAPGYYQVEFVGDGQAAGGMNYNYKLIGSLEEYWPGLPYGETYFE